MSESSFDKNLAKVEDAIRKKNPEYAIQILTTQLLKTQPDSQKANELYFKAVQAKWAAGKVPKPAWMKTKQLQAQQLARRWDGLADSCRTHYPNDPANSKCLELLAESLMQTKNFHAAYETLKHLTERVDPKIAQAWSWRAQCEDNLGLIEDACKSCDRAVALDGASKVFNDQRRSLSAKQAFVKNKDKEGVLEVAGGKDKLEATIKDRGHRGKEATLEQIAKLGGLEGTDRKNMMEVARLYESISDYNSCIKAWKRVYEIDPHYVDALDNAGIATIKAYQQMIEKHKRDGNAEKEADTRQKLAAFKLREIGRKVEQRPTDTGLRYDLGEALYEAGRYKEAASELQKASKDPKKANLAARMLGRSFFEIEQFDLAEMQFQKFLEQPVLKDEERLDAKYWLAKSKLSKNQKDAAKQIFMEILMEDVGFKDVDEIVKAL